MKGHIRQRLAAVRLSGLRPKGRRYPPGLGLGTIPAAREWLIVVGDSASECRCGRYWHIGWRALSLGASLMTSDDVYRKHAAEADREARLAKSDLDRAAWLRVAEGWKGLLRKRPQSEDDDSEPPK
jgi:hypothetical protein